MTIAAAGCCDTLRPDRSLAEWRASLSRGLVVTSLDHIATTHLNGGEVCAEQQEPRSVASGHGSQKAAPVRSSSAPARGSFGLSHLGSPPLGLSHLGLS
jgi:hypothetical protein